MFGVTEVIIGAAVTVNAPLLVTEPPSLLVTVRSRAPAAALRAISTTTVSCVTESRVTESTLNPAPEKATVGVVPKPVPVTTIERF